MRYVEALQAIDGGRIAVEHQPRDTGALGGLEDRGLIRLRRNAVARDADVDEAVAAGRIGIDRQVVVSQCCPGFRCQMQDRQGDQQLGLLAQARDG